jgi:hypothetical protein
VARRHGSIAAMSWEAGSSAGGGCGGLPEEEKAIGKGGNDTH